MSGVDGVCESIGKSGFFPEQYVVGGKKERGHVLLNICDCSHSGERFYRPVLHPITGGIRYLDEYQSSLRPQRICWQNFNMPARTLIFLVKLTIDLEMQKGKSFEQALDGAIAVIREFACRKEKFQFNVKADNSEFHLYDKRPFPTKLNVNISLADRFTNPLKDDEKLVNEAAKRLVDVAMKICSRCPDPMPAPPVNPNWWDPWHTFPANPNWDPMPTFPVNPDWDPFYPLPIRPW